MTFENCYGKESGKTHLPWLDAIEKTPEDITAAWTRTTDKLYELLQWAHSEGLADLATMNGFLETMADQTDLFKTVKSDLEQQKNVILTPGPDFWLWFQFRSLASSYVWNDDPEKVGGNYHTED